jgi:SAM-dependent methyltransferase
VPELGQDRATATIHDLRLLMEQEPDGLIEEISPRDGMFVGNREHYFEVAQSALECARLALIAAGKDEVQSILDLPCGHGRVLRKLKAAFPEAALTACDLERDGVDFCAEVFGATPVYSEEDPAHVQIASPFDLIWCGSLFTHLDDERWRHWLDRFHSLLSVGGVLVFTAHGRHTVAAMREPDVVLDPAGLPREYGVTNADIAAILNGYEREGFGFAPYEEAERFGISASSPSWVMRELGASHFRVVTYVESGWDSHQDVVGCVGVEPEP